MTNANSLITADVIIIGSGLSGISAARDLTAAQKNCLVLDKGRRIGGRCATKRKDGFVFNHGAQFFTTKDPAFTKLTQDAMAEGAVKIWDIGHHRTAYIGAPTMRDFLSYLAGDIPVRQEVKITHISRSQTGYRLIDESGQSYGCQQLLVSVPAPQVPALLDDVAPDLVKTAQSAAYDPCWTVMLGLAEAIEINGMPVRDKGDIGFASYEPLRHLLSEAEQLQPALSIQASPEKSHQMLDWHADDVIEEMIQAFTDMAGPLPDITQKLSHRWLYARVAQPADTALPFISQDNSLALAGDYFGAARLESAFISGRRAANALLG